MRGRRTFIIGYLLLIGLLGLWGCGSPSPVSDADAAEQTKAVSESDAWTDVNVETDVQDEMEAELIYKSSMELQYARNFAVDYYEGGYVMLTTKMDGRKLLVVPEGKSIPQALDENIVVLRQPVENLYLVASAAMDMFRELDAMDRIRFSGQKADGWYIEEARAAMEKGSMLYAGKYSMPDYELIVSEGCTLAIENTMISHSPEVIEKLNEFKIPVMIDYSSYETHPLGRVEWIKVYGALLGKETQADEAFAKQVDILDRVSKEERTEKTVAFFYITSNGTVNVRKTSDYIPQMINLAGGNYIFQDLGSEEDHRSSVNMTMEEFYATAKDADYLIYNSTIDGEIQTMEELLGKSEMLRDFKAVREGNVWCTTNDLYQHSMSIGRFIEDLYEMLSGEPDSEEHMKYIYLLN